MYWFALAECGVGSQGTLLKRHRIAKRAGADGSVDYYGWQDLVVGNEITFYGR